MSTPEEVLRTVARDEKKRVQRCEFYDRNVCDFEFTDLKVHVDPVSKKYRVSAPLIRSGAPFTSKVRLDRAGNPVYIWASSEAMLISVPGQLRIRAVCSINSPNADDFKMTKVVLEGSVFPVFIRSEQEPTKGMIDFVSDSEVQRSTQALIKRDADSMHFRVGEIALYFRPQCADEARNAIEILLRFLVATFRPQRERWDLTELPPEFQHLIPLIKKWAESDDDLRTDLINEAGESSLRELIEKVAPLFASINTYLDNFQVDPPEAAMALQTLAESAAEAQVAIEDRSDRN